MVTYLALTTALQPSSRGFYVHLEVWWKEKVHITTVTHRVPTLMVKLLHVGFSRKGNHKQQGYLEHLGWGLRK